MKKIIVNESILRQIIAEMAKERKLVTEIKVADAYARFYQDKIPQDVYEALMKGTDKMTPFHKIVLDSLLQVFTGESKDDQNLHRDILYSASTIGNKWSAANNDARQLLLRYIQTMSSPARDFSKFENLVDVTNTILSKGGHTESSYCDRGLVKLYEDDKILVTCTTSYAASKKYYGDTHWCTASDIGGNYNGFKMFGEYTCDNYEERTILVQFVDKENRERTIQVAFEYGLAIYQACDYFDHEIEYEELTNYLNRIIGLDNLEKIIPWEDLYDQTCKLYGEEYEYWEEKFVSYIKKITNDIKEKIKKGEYNEILTNAINTCINKKWTRWFDDGLLLVFESQPERYKAEGTYTCTAHFYGKHYEAINNFQEENDISVTPVMSLLVKKGVNEEYYIAEKVYDMSVVNATPAFIRVENANKTMALSWRDFSPILTSRCATTLRSITLFFDEDYNWDGEDYQAKAIDNQTGQIVYEGLVNSINIWADTFRNGQGRLCNKLNNWGQNPNL